MKKFSYKLILMVFISVSYIASSDLSIASPMEADSIVSDYEAGEQANQKGDRKTAFIKFHAAAQQRDDKAYGKLASMYLYGLGTEKDYHQAYIWFHMSYLSGDRYAERFRDAASSMMTRETYEKAVQSAEQQRVKLKLEKTPPQQKPPLPPVSS